MIVYLVGHNPAIKMDGVHVLESFFYADAHTEESIPKCKSLLLDSGAFTLFSSKTLGKGIVWEEYVDKYAAFILKHRVKLFFELDIDKLVGREKTLELRRRLERKAGRRCIPVWHKFRGRDEFIRMCEEYNYVAIGGIVSKEIVPSEYKFFPWFIDEAHKRKAKIHGLGFTTMRLLPKYHFDSVDSTTWRNASRFGEVHFFNGRTIKRRRSGRRRLVEISTADLHNFNEWVKFQQYAETHY